VSTLDLLSAVGTMKFSGPGSFDEAVRVISTDVSAKDVRRDLFGLGHIILDHQRRSVLAAKPRLVSLPRHKESEVFCVLAGARNIHLIDELDHLASSRDVRRESYPISEHLPERISFTGRPEAIAEMAVSCNTAALGPVDNLQIPDAWRLLARVQSLQSIVAGLAEQRTGLDRVQPRDNDEIYNPGTGYFDLWSELRGSYRSRYLVWRKAPYDFRFSWREEGDETWIQRLSALGQDPRWLFWSVRISADPKGALPGIDAEGSFSVPVECPLPLDLHRVCCLCSGYTPHLAESMQIYDNIPPVIQKHVIDKLRLPPTN